MRTISGLYRSSALPLLVLFLLFCSVRDISTQPSVEAAQSKPIVSVATLGQEGADKSTLTAAIVKVLSDSGKAKFVSIDEISNPSEINVQGVRLTAAQVEYETDRGRYTHVDCRTKADCVKLLSSGRVKLDGAILVVSAIDGPMPQTLEQVQLAQKSGVKGMVVYLNKVSSQTDPELLGLVILETRELLSKYGFKGDTVPFIQGNASLALAGNKGSLGKESIIKLLSAMDAQFIK